MNLKKLNKLAVMIAPSVLLPLYVALDKAVLLLEQRDYQPRLSLVLLAADFIFGIYIFLLCKYSFRSVQPGKVRLEYLLSILFVLCLCLLTFIPLFNLGVLNFFLLGCLPQFGIVSAVSIGIFIDDCLRRKKK